jgi:hypothetical protein
MGYVRDGSARDTISGSDESLRAITDGFFERLGSHLEGADGMLERRIRSSIAGVMGRAAHLVANDLDRATVGFAVLAVTAYEALVGDVGEHAAIGIVAECLNEPLRAPILAGTKALLDRAPDAFRALVEVSKQREAHQFGPSFTFERPVDEAWGYVLVVRRCLFHEALRACGRTELQPILCHFDMNWVDAIEPERHHLRFVRPTTFATADTCRMCFLREEGEQLAERSG